MIYCKSPSGYQSNPWRMDKPEQDQFLPDIINMYFALVYSTSPRGQREEIPAELISGHKIRFNLPNTSIIYESANLVARTVPDVLPPSIRPELKFLIKPLVSD
ncbi:hypothetical protein RUM44_008763 [Polyplax serrata]|uniref:Uncharacterized protein n=1 Tax=Polyplax serrata TaxID=468196 RepID=A0ABR1BB41_POLSC